MTNTIELLFCTGPAAPGHEGSEGDQQDTWAAAGPGPDAYEARKNNEAELEQLHIGQSTVGEVVRGMNRVFGHELYSSKILHDAQTTKVFLELSKTPVTEWGIYDITDGGVVNTNMIRAPAEIPQMVDHIFVKFRPIFTERPSVLFGLNYLEQDHPGTIYITGTVKQIHDELFYLYSSAWSPQVTLHGVGYTWLALPSYKHPLLQVGTCQSTTGNSGWTQKTITFHSPYKAPPKVVVWLNTIICKKKVAVSVTHITATDFEVQISTVDDTFPETISWFAYPSDTPGICSGNLDNTAGIIQFDKPFRRPPRRILVALTCLFTQEGQPCRFKIIHEAVSAKGMAVRVVTWGESELFDVRIAYIAME